MLFNDWGTVNAIYNFGGMQEKDKDNKVTGVIIKVYLSQNIQEYFIQKFFKGCLPQILLGPFLNIPPIYDSVKHLDLPNTH